MVKSFPGVRTKECIRNNKKDVYFSIRYTRNGKQYEESIGYKSEGFTAAQAYEILSELKRDIKTGKALSLREKTEQREQERRLFSLWDYAMLKGLAVSVGMQAAHTFSTPAAMKAALIGMASVFAAKIVGIPLIIQMDVWREKAQYNNIKRRLIKSKHRMEEAKAKRAAKNTDIPSTKQIRTVEIKEPEKKGKKKAPDGKTTTSIVKSGKKSR